MRTATSTPLSSFSMAKRLTGVTLGALCLLGLAPLAQAQYGGTSSGPKPNFRIGPVNFHVTGTFTAEYNTNILSLRSGAAAKDIILTPGFDFAGSWKLSKFNTLQLDLGMGYQIYVQHPELSSINNFMNMSPDSRLAFKMKMGAFTVTPYESLSFSTDATSVSGVAAASVAQGQPTTYARFTNQAGIDVIWHLNRKMEPYLHLFRSDTVPFKSKAFESDKHHTYTFNPGFTYAVASNLRAGLDFNASMNKYATDFNNSSKSYSLGPTANWTITPNANLSGGINYAIYDFKGDGKNKDSSQPKNLQWNISFVHTPRANFQYSLFTNQALNYGYTSNTTRTTDFGLSFQWRFLKRTTLRGAFVHEKGLDSGGILAEKYKSNTGGFGLDFAMNPRTTLSFDYEHTKKTSDIALRDFTQDRFIVGCAYDF